LNALDFTMPCRASVTAIFFTKNRARSDTQTTDNK
jgi:hypothetical protein